MERLKRARRKFEYDPEFQTKFHLGMTYFWMANFVVASLVFFFAPGLWQQASIFYLVIVSLYANFATDYGAVSAAESSDAAHDAAAQ